MSTTGTFSDERVPEGFMATELVQQLDGPIHHEDGRIEQDSRTLRWGLQHVYDDGELRIAVRRGDRETYSASGFYMDIQTVAGRPGQTFTDIGAALAAAWNLVLENRRTTGPVECA